MQNADLLPFDMPVLQSDFSVGGNADHIEREAYEKAFAAGEKAGFEMGEQKAQVLIEKVEILINDLTTLKKTIAKEVEPQCLELAVSIARKIVIKELTVKPEEIVRMVKEALLKLERTGQITIKVNPALYDFFTRHKPDIINIHPDIVIDADPSVSRYGTVVMGPVEDVVTDVDEQLKNLIKDLGDRHARD
jgi:flagellar assembly protein FliH